MKKHGTKFYHFILDSISDDEEFDRSERFITDRTLDSDSIEVNADEVKDVQDVNTSLDAVKQEECTGTSSGKLSFKISDIESYLRLVISFLF